jgi:hypothetical protein
LGRFDSSNPGLERFDSALVVCTSFPQGADFDTEVEGIGENGSGDGRSGYRSSREPKVAGLRDLRIRMNASMYLFVSTLKGVAVERMGFHQT